MDTQIKAKLDFAIKENTRLHEQLNKKDNLIEGMKELIKESVLHLKDEFDFDSLCEFEDKCNEVLKE